jgi:hypothetical protein
MKTYYNSVCQKKLLSFGYNSSQGIYNIKQKYLTSTQLQNDVEFKLREYRQYYSIETKCMPDSGWKVDLDYNICPCLYWKKFGICIHIIFARERKNSIVVGRNPPYSNKRG